MFGAIKVWIEWNFYFSIVVDVKKCKWVKWVYEKKIYIWYNGCYLNKIIYFIS